MRTDIQSPTKKKKKIKKRDGYSRTENGRESDYFMKKVKQNEKEQEGERACKTFQRQTEREREKKITDKQEGIRKEIEKPI